MNERQPFKPSPEEEEYTTVSPDGSALRFLSRRNVPPKSLSQFFFVLMTHGLVNSNIQHDLHD